VIDFARIINIISIAQLAMAMMYLITGDVVKLWSSLVFAYMNRYMLITVYGDE
jgi:hypothetical protein